MVRAYEDGHQRVRLHIAGHYAAENKKDDSLRTVLLRFKMDSNQRPSD